MPQEFRDSLEALLVVGLATELAAWGIGTYDENGYAPDAVLPIYFGPDEPANTPDERLLLTVRTWIPGTTGPRVGETPVGFNWRGPADADPLAAVNFLGLLYRRLHRLSHHSFGPVRVGLVRRSSAGAIGRDTNRRPGATATYMFRGLLASVNQ